MPVHRGALDAGVDGSEIVEGVVATVVALAISSPASALNSRVALTQYVHDVWQTEQGLPQKPR